MKHKFSFIKKSVKHFKDVIDKFRYLYYGLKDNFNNLIKHISDKLVNSKSKDKL